MESFAPTIRRYRQVPEDRIKTLYNGITFYDDIPIDMQLDALFKGMSHEIAYKLREFNKYKIIGSVLSSSIDVIVPYA